MPHQIGTEVTNCEHMELGALNSDFEMLGANDPCLHLLDSNATAFAARGAMRDNPTPTMRRRVRGTGVASGKCDLERMRNTIDAWEDTNGEDIESVKMSSNQRQRKNPALIVEQMNGWKVPHWSPTYRDNTDLHPIILVDSHQLNDSGKQSGRYKKITPCQAFVSANELADKLCSVTLGEDKKTGIELSGNSQGYKISTKRTKIYFYSHG
jgi:hypothetical protein